MKTHAFFPVVLILAGFTQYCAAEIEILAEPLGNGKLQIGYDASGDSGNPAGINLEFILGDGCYLASETDILHVDPCFNVFIDYIYENIDDYEMGEGFPLGDPCQAGLPMMPTEHFVLVLGNLDTQRIPERRENLVTMQLYNDAGTSSRVEIKPNELRGGLVTVYWEKEIPVIEYARVEPKEVLVHFDGGVTDVKPFVVDRCLVKADVHRNQEQVRDTIVLMGSGFEVAESVLEENDRLTFEIANSEDETILEQEVVYKTASGKQPSFIKKGVFVFKSKTNALNMIQIDTNRDTLMLMAKDIDLTGLDSPLTVMLRVGDFTGVAQAADSDAGDAQDVINARKPMPGMLLMNHRDSLSVTKAVFRRNAKTELDTLIVTGEMTVIDASAVNVEADDVSVRFGSYNVSLAGAELNRLGNRDVYHYKAGRGGENPLGLLLLDFERGRYSVVVQHAAIGDQGCEVAFGMAFDGFDEGATADVCK